MRRAIGAGAVYFAAVFAVGFVLGTVRVLWLAPRLGERVAELAEMPFMLAASWLAARWVVGRLAAPVRVAERAVVGVVGLAILLGFEFGIVRALRGLTLAEALGGRDPVAFAVYLATVVAFAVMPLVVHRPMRTSRDADARTRLR